MAYLELKGGADWGGGEEELVLDEEDFGGIAQCPARLPRRAAATQLWNERVAGCRDGRGRAILSLSILAA